MYFEDQAATVCSSLRCSIGKWAPAIRGSLDLGLGVCRTLRRNVLRTRSLMHRMSLCTRPSQKRTSKSRFMKRGMTPWKLLLFPPLTEMTSYMDCRSTSYFAAKGSTSHSERPCGKVVVVGGIKETSNYRPLSRKLKRVTAQAAALFNCASSGGF